LQIIVAKFKIVYIFVESKQTNKIMETSANTIKVNVTLTYTKTIINTQDIEMTKEEYKEYLKTGKVSFDTESEVSSAEDFVTWVEYVDVDVEKIK
jgi:hypothetical protein